MGIIYQHDARSGITYAYESVSYWDKEKKQSRSKRTLIGRVDEETGEIVPTDGRRRKKNETSHGKESLEQTIAQRLYGNSLKNFVMNLYRQKSITDDDISELRQFLETLEEEK
ncbi:MAG: BlaI/MecI/CopY family transcriptional regulator [Peptococcaceae bacterium]|nr:BlaI/MecI/CopY family transcriptional regulator [Peptococcaceae bacterium]